MSKEYGLGLLKSKKGHGTSCYVMPKKALLLASITMYCAPSIDWPRYQDRAMYTTSARTSKSNYLYFRSNYYTKSAQ